MCFRKIRNHPLMGQVWQQCLANELDENELVLTAKEVAALSNAARTPEEKDVTRKIPQLRHGSRSDCCQ